MQMFCTETLRILVTLADCRRGSCQSYQGILLGCFRFIVSRKIAKVRTNLFGAVSATANSRDGKWTND